MCIQLMEICSAQWGRTQDMWIVFTIRLLRHLHNYDNGCVRSFVQTYTSSRLLSSCCFLRPYHYYCGSHVSHLRTRLALPLSHSLYCSLSLLLTLFGYLSTSSTLSCVYKHTKRRPRVELCKRGVHCCRDGVLLMRRAGIGKEETVL